MQAKALPGFRDFYPEAMALRTFIFSVWRRVAARYGFEEYDGPPLEALDLYTAKSGEEIVQQLYAFTDRGGRAVALRPEMTPTLARMVAARAKAVRKPIRWYSVPQLFRYERQQRGRLREHFQLNMDIIGAPGPLADAEIMGAAIDVVRACGLGPADFTCRVSDRRLAAAVLTRRIGVSPEQVPAAFQVLDKIGAGTAEARALAERRFGQESDAGRALMGLVECLGSGEQPEWLVEALDWPEGQHLRGTLEALDWMELRQYVALDLKIVRGLAYYSGPVFELFDEGEGLRAICGGGRYDGLLEALGAVDLPALGFGMGDVVLGELLKARGAAPGPPVALDAFLVAVTPDDQPTVLGLARRLRDAGRAVEFALASTPVRRQLELAGTRGARFAVIVGPDERARGEAVVRNMTTSEERRLPLQELTNAMFS